MPKKGESPRSRDVRQARLHMVRDIADRQGGVVSRDQLRTAGITPDELESHLRGHRWCPVHSQSIAVHTGPWPDAGRLWAAVFEAGDRGCLDGASALIAGGLEHYTEDVIRVSVPRGVLTRHAVGVEIRQTRRLEPDDLAPSGIPRTRPEVAGVRAGLWARSDKQATLLLTMTAQQGLTTADRLGAQVMRVKRDRRRIILTGVIADLVGGVRSLGEHEFARMCRLRRLPEPTRQALRRGPRGQWYLDVCWEPWGVVVEIDGIHHEWAANVVADALRHNAIALDRAVVLRLPLLGLRLAPDEFFAQITAALVARGCPLDVAS
ncbi:hypothetical protein [Nocardioides zhouii]|uniref:DUF559 domain-containing protein n=1 Tax=Nocardioides zhouii TaxID=1168729 RepID=A0A4Q2T5X9_9ACTN|nr:hypothetical protein [Nocardioides zhouii]RYC12520.1 hypothetical protein EUA94_07565 [Nocardioides zhouii]